jgi:hypothetical protein
MIPLIKMLFLYILTFFKLLLENTGSRPKIKKTKTTIYYLAVKFNFLRYKIKNVIYLVTINRYFY